MSETKPCSVCGADTDALFGACGDCLFLTLTDPPTEPCYPDDGTPLSRLMASHRTVKGNVPIIVLGRYADGQVEVSVSHNTGLHPATSVACVNMEKLARWAAKNAGLTILESEDS